MTATVHDLDSYRKKREAQQKAMQAVLFGIRYGNPNALKVKFPIRTKTYYHKVVFNKDFFTCQPEVSEAPPENDKPE